MRTITIKGKSGRWNDNAPFLLESGALEVTFVLPAFSGEFFATAKQNGKKSTPEKISNGSVLTFSTDPGEFSLEVTHYCRGEEVGRYPVEPLLIKAVNDRVSAFPEISDLRARVDALECASKAQKEKLSGIAEGVPEWLKQADAAIHKRDVSLLAYMWADYKYNVQLNEKNLGLKDFISALGYEIRDFSQDDLEYIESKKEAF